MVTASATFEIDPGTGSFSPPGAYAVASGGATVICRIADVTGIKSATWRIYGTHSSAVSAPAITLGGTPYGQTAMFTLPAGTGQAYGIECVAIRTDNHQLEPVTSKVLVDWAHGNVNLRPVFNNETTQQDATHGWVMQFNYLLEHAFDGATGPAGPPGGETFPWTYATSTVDADPGNGLLRMDGASFAATDTLFVDLINANGVDMTDWLDSIEGGTITLFRGDARSTNFAIYRIEAVATATGYRKIHLRERIVSVGSLDTTAANTYVSLDRSGGGDGGGDIFEVSVTATLGTAAANTVTYEAVTVPGVLAGDVVIAVDTDDLGTPTSVLQAIVTDDEEITLPLCNPSSGGDAVGELDLKFLIYRPGNSLRQYTATVDFGTVPTIETSYIAASVPGVRVGDFVVATVHDIDAPSGTGMCRVTGDNAVEIPIVNPSGSGDIVGAKSVTFTVVRLGVPGFLLKSATLTLAEVPADTAPHFSHTVTGALDGDYVCNVTADLSATELTLSDARVSADDTIEFSAANPTAGGITPGATAVTVLLWRPSNAGGGSGDGSPGSPGNPGLDGAPGAAGRPGGDSFLYTFKTDVDDSDPFTPFAKLNNTIAPNATMLFLDEDSYDVAAINDWIESFPEGGVVHLYERDDPSTFAIFRIGTVTASTNSITINYYKIALTELLESKEGNWTFDTTEGNLVVALARGTGAAATQQTSKSGARSVFGRWGRIQNRSIHGYAQIVPYFTPGINQWQFVGFEGNGQTSHFYQDPADGNNYGRLYAFISDEDGGNASLDAISMGDMGTSGTGSAIIAQRSIQAGRIIDSAGTAMGPVVVMTMPYPVSNPTTQRTFVGVYRTEGNGTASNRLLYTDNNWYADPDGIRLTGTKTLNFLDADPGPSTGPSAIVFTGQNVIITYNTSHDNFDVSSDGDTFVEVAKPSSAARNHIVHNGQGRVIASGSAADYDISTNHGLAWTGGTFPELLASEAIAGLTWWPALQQFYALTTFGRYSLSTDGVAWSTWQYVQFDTTYYEETSSGHTRPLRRNGLVVAGDVLACPWYCSKELYATPTIHDLFWTEDGVTWSRSGSFKRNLFDETASPSGQRSRMKLASTTAVVNHGTDRVQLVLVPAFGSPYNTQGGDGVAQAWISDVDTLFPAAGSGTTATTVTSSGTGSAFVRMQFSDSTVVGDPGDGFFRCNTSSVLTATQLVLSDRNTSDQIITTAVQIPGRRVIHIYDAATGDTVYQLHCLVHTDEDGYTVLDIDNTLSVGNGAALVDGQEYSFSIDVYTPRFPRESQWAAQEPFGSVVADTWTVFIPFDEFYDLTDGVYVGSLHIVTGGGSSNFTPIEVPFIVNRDDANIVNSFRFAWSESDLTVFVPSLVEAVLTVSLVDVSGEKFCRVDVYTTTGVWGVTGAMFRIVSFANVVPSY